MTFFNLWTRVMSFFISLIQRAALSQHKLCDNEWCQCSSEGFRVVSLNDLHYFNMNFVNKSDSCFISSIEWTALSQCEFCEQEWCHFSSEGIPLNDPHYRSMNFVNKSDVMFHQFHWMSCTISMWGLWTRVMSFFFTGNIPDCWVTVPVCIDVIVNSGDVTFHQRDSQVFHWMSCTVLTWTSWTRVTSYRACRLFHWDKLHYVDVNLVDKSDVISEGFQTSSTDISCAMSVLALWARVIVIFQTIPFNELLYLKWGMVSKTGVVAHQKDSTFHRNELHSNKEFLDPNMEFVSKTDLVSRQTNSKLFSWVTFSQNDLGEWRGWCIISYVYMYIYYNVLRSIPDLKYSKNCIAFFVLVSCRILNLLYFVEQLCIFPISHKHHSDSLFIPMLQLHDVPFWRYSQTAMQVRNIQKIMCPNSIYAAK